MNNYIFMSAEDAESFLSEYSDLFDSLAAMDELEVRLKEYKPTHKELDVVQWLISNMFGIKKEIKKTHNPAYHLFPDNFFFVYLDNYAQNVISIIKKHLQESHVELNPEEINLIVTKEWLTMLFGERFLEPPKNIKKEFDSEPKN